MAIINRGIFQLTDTVFERAVGNDWPTAQVLTTFEIAEGSNLYYTNARVDSRVAELSINVLADVDITSVANNSILIYDGDTNKFVPTDLFRATAAEVANIVLTLDNFTTSNVAEGVNLYYTNARVLSYLSTADVTVQDLIVQGDITVQGNTTTLNTATLTIEDKNIVLANGAPNPAAANGAGITIEGANASITYLSSGDVIEINKNVNIAGNIALSNNDSITGANLITTNVLIVYDRIEGAGGAIAVASADFATLANVANVVTTLENFTSDYLVEGSTNYYYTNSRVVSAVTPLLVTSNVIEGTNLYYTNSRVNTWLQGANVDVVSLTASGNVVGQNFISSGVGSPSITSATNINLTANSISGGAVIITNSSLRLRNYSTTDRGNLTPASGDLIFNNTVNEFQFYNGTEWISVGSVSDSANVANTVLSISNFTTANLTEGTNLYYTNTRVLSAVNPRLTTANVSELTNLYYTNARVDSRIAETSVNALSDVDITGIQTNDVISWDGTKFIASAPAGGVADTANTVVTLDNFTTSNLAEGSNFYFSNTRARLAFTAGRGISISERGTITSIDDSADFNLLHDGYKDYRLTSSMASAVEFSGLPATSRAIMRSIHLTNISDDIAYFSGNIIFGDGNTVAFANCIPVPDGSSLELLKRSQIFGPNDIVNLQGFNNSLVPTSNVIDAIFTYETVTNDTSFASTGNTMTVAGAEYVIANAAGSFSIVESVRLINLDGSISRANVYTKDANNNIRAYWAYRVALPTNSSLEILQGPKKLNQGDTLVASPNSNVAILVSYRNSDTVLLTSQSTSATAGGNVSVVLDTTIEDGTTIYYTIG